MTLDDAPARPADDAPAPTRRALRERARTGETAVVTASGETQVVVAEPAVPPTDASERHPEPAADPVTSDAAVVPTRTPKAKTKAPRTATTTTVDAAPPRIAFAWVDERVVATAPVLVAPSTSPYVPVEPDLLARAPRRSPWRPGVIVPILLIAVLFGGYAATTLLWPLYALPPKITEVPVQPIAAPATTLPWPGAGSAAVSVGGIAGDAASSPNPAEIASITKIVTALLVLESQPLAVGQTGPDYRFSSSDRSLYWTYRSNGESALDVPVGGSLTQFQMMEGMLIGSANNYADRLASGIWPTDAVFASAASTWLSSHGVTGVTIVDPTGIDPANTASPAALLTLAKLAMANPVIAQIVATPSVDLPGAGLVTNTNGLLADPGVKGIKTGSLDGYNLLTAKDVTVGSTVVRMYAAVLGQPDDGARVAVSRDLYAQMEKELQASPVVPSGTVVATADTRWGDPVNVVVESDASVLLWNGATGAASSTFAVGDARGANDVVGSFTLSGPLNTTSVGLRLAADIEPPSAWWRLTHPLDLFGLNN